MVELFGVLNPAALGIPRLLRFASPYVFDEGGGRVTDPSLPVRLRLAPHAHLRLRLGGVVCGVAELRVDAACRVGCVAAWWVEFAGMLTDSEIADLISRPKRIVKKTPASGYLEESRNRRCDLELVSLEDDRCEFRVFIRQNTNFIENFSIGLRHRVSGDPTLATLTLVRYNGPHGESSISPDGHYAVPHIHRITEVEIASGSYQPQERHREVTSRYSTYESALRVFWGDVGVSDDANINKHFPGLMQSRMFDE